MNLDLENKNVFIAEGSPTLASTLAQAFADEGARVITGEEKLAEHADIDILVWGHPSLPMRPFLELDAAMWQKNVTDELARACSMAKAISRGMVKNKYGKMIFVTSCAGVGGAENTATMSAIGTGIVGFAKSLSRELIRYNITVNTIAHGIMDYEMELYDESFHREMQKVFKYSGLPRLCTASDVVGAALFLAAQQSSYITGQTLHVNGGLIV